MTMPGEQVFGEQYASLYDATYVDKDYDLECRVIQKAIENHRPDSNQGLRILDLGCGTGEHAIRLARMGHDVTGVDIADGMLARARKKAAIESVAVDFRRGDISELDYESSFDVAVMMFAVLGYQTTNEALLSTLRGVRRALAPGGLVVFDAWYGPAVLSLRPEPRTKTIRHGSQELTRESLATIDVFSQTCRVDIRMTGPDGSEVVDESHTMRFFFAQELHLLLEESGLEVRALGAFPDPESHLTESDWNLVCVAATR